jgi:flagellar hook-associated protein 2
VASPINFSGAASGLDTQLIIDALLGLKQQRVDRLNKKLGGIGQQRNAINDLKSVLTTLKDKAAAVESGIFGKRQTTVSDTDVLGATAGAGAQLGQYAVKVSQLARQGAATVGGTVTSASEVLGAGTLTIQNQGGETFSVTLTDPGSTLADLRQAITDQHGDSLNANIIETTPGAFQLAITTRSAGSDENILGSSGFTGFSSSPAFSASGVSNTQTALDAKLVVDGISITRTTNSISDVISGVTLNLKQESASATQVSVSASNDEVVKGLQEFADAYNAALSKINELSAIGGTFSADSSFRALKSELQSTVTRLVPNIGAINLRDGGEVGFTSLAQVGFKTDSKTGQVSIDSTVLKEALTDHFAEVENLFKGGSTSSNANVSLLTRPATPFSGSISLDSVSDTATIDGQVYNLTRQGNVLSFAAESPYAGMSFQADTAVSGVSLELSAGLGDLLSDRLGFYTSFDGVLSDRTSSLSDQEKRLNSDIDRAVDRIDSERTRLTRIFAAAEQAIADLQGLQSSLGLPTGR